MNQQLLQGMKRRPHEQLKYYSGTWVDELPSILWSIRTTPSRTTGCTPFMLVYGTGAVRLVEVALGFARVHMVDQESPGLENERRLDLDLVEGVKIQAML